jgi:DNA-binding PadR family transcriptional regulator
MANVADSEADAIPKTQLILSLLAEQGPKTEYELYKQLPKLSHGTIHYCLNKLAEDGAITYTQSKHKKKQTKKQYYLTFIGTVTHVASSLYWQVLKLTDSQIEEHWKQFDEVEQKEIIEFLCRQGKLLNYALFEESHWLAERYPGIARAFAIIAYLICEHPPQPYKNLLLAAATGKRHFLLFDWRERKEKMPSDRELIEQLQDAYRREFTRLFFEVIVLMKHNSQAITNLRLRQLAKEELEQQKCDMAGLELAIQLFGRQANKNNAVESTSKPIDAE